MYTFKRKVYMHTSAVILKYFILYRWFTCTFSWIVYYSSCCFNV